MKKANSKKKQNVTLPVKIFGQPLPLKNGETLAEGVVVEPHADYGLLNEEASDEKTENK